MPPRKRLAENTVAGTARYWVAPNQGANPVAYASSSRMTSPYTSVSRKSRPA